MAKTIQKKVIRWGPTIVWAGVIFFISSLSTLPSPEIIWWDFVLKKSAHMIEYGIFYFLLSRSTNWNKKPKNYWLPAFLAIIYALTDEYHQSFVPGRHA